MPEFEKFQRVSIAEMRPWQIGDDMTNISVSQPDREAGSPKAGDMIARNPNNHADQWLVARQYFVENFAPMNLLPDPKTFEADLALCINRWSKENGSNTPDFILASYLAAQLVVFDQVTVAREKWYGRGYEGVEKSALDHAQDAMMSKAMEEQQFSGVR